MITSREIEDITWRELTGNKFTRGLDPAMVTEQGYIAQVAVRKIGEARKSFFNVLYDYDYLMEAIGRYICKPMFILGKKKTLALVGEAWDRFYPYQASEGDQVVEVANGDNS